MADANGLRPVFEPLHPRVSKTGQQYSHRALAWDESHPHLEQFLADACAGKRERFWTQYRCQTSFLLPGFDELRSYAGMAAVAHRWRKLMSDAPALARAAARSEPLVKCIWSNLMLGWLSKHCGFRVVLLLRHPGAVVESELRNAWNAGATLQRFRTDRSLHEITGGRYLRLLERKLSPVEELAVKWLVENQHPVETAGRDSITVVHYELLRSSDDREWRRLRECLSLERLPDSATLVRPSQQSAARDSEAMVRDAVTMPRWQAVLTREQKSQIQGVLEETHFGVYSMEETLPSGEARRIPESARQDRAL